MSRRNKGGVQKGNTVNNTPPPGFPRERFRGKKVGRRGESR